MLFPDNLQAALLLDGACTSLDGVHKSFAVNDLVHHNVRYTNMEVRPGYFRLLGDNGLMVTAELINRPAQPGVFTQALGSAFNRMVLCPDGAERISRHRSHILIWVSHAAQTQGLRASAPEGATLAQLQKRLAKLAFLTSHAMQEVPVALVHWTQSNEIFTPALFKNAALNPVPGPLHIHPVLFTNAEKRIGLRTFGAQHFIGREVLIEPHIVPWQALYIRAIDLVQMAAGPQGYIVPDGDTFGPPDHSESYRVHHRAPENGGVPILELEPLLHQASGFQSPAYIPRERVFDDRTIPPDVQPEDRAAQDAQRAELRGLRRMAEEAGNSFEVRATLPREEPPRPVFGRKKPEGS